MECLGTLFLLYVGFRVFAWFLRAINEPPDPPGIESQVRNTGSPRPSPAPAPAPAPASLPVTSGGREVGPSNLSVDVFTDKFRPRGTRDTLPVLRVSVSGEVRVPNTNEPVNFVVRVMDCTGSQTDLLPVFCLIPDMADNNGLFNFEQSVDLPHRSCTIEGLPLVSVPTFALVGPRSGQRKLRFLVLIVSRRDERKVFGAGTTVCQSELLLPGYEELAERTQHREGQIAQLALALAAADGRIEKRELAVVRRFFAERHAKITDEGERSRRVEQLLDKAMSEFKGKKGSQLKEMTNKICDDLAAEGEEAVIQSAYELAVQVVAADDSVDEREQQTLAHVAARLKVPPGFVKEVHDRNLRANMFGEGSVEATLGIPEGLSPDQKKKFLADEYRRWRGRVTHDDPKIAAEAALRLKLIAQAQAALQDD